MSLCDKNIPVDISKESKYESIYNLNIDPKMLIMLCDFFQYRTANEIDSPLSLKLDSMLSETQKDELYNNLLKSINANECDFLFNSILRNKIKEIRLMELSDTTLKCDRIKGFFHQKNPNSNGASQHKIDSLFKRIRDSFAHGRIAFVGSYLILEDKKEQLTGRLIITVDALLKWKNVIDEFMCNINKEV